MGTCFASDPILLIHGGAWSIPDPEIPDHLKGLRSALAAGWTVLSTGGSALDAVEAAVAAMEDCDTFAAGRGSFLNRDGRVQLDALMMEGAGLRAGGVACVERVRNPIRAARKVLSESPHAYLVGAGAERFAEERGLPLCEPEDLVLARELERLKHFRAQANQLGAELFLPEAGHDTVGAVALDASGILAAATSTGGTLGKIPGRVGDSSLIGCGCYADNATAAASLTGWGEPIMRLVLAKWACDRVSLAVGPEHIADLAIRHLQQRLGGYGGIILLDAQGRFGIRHNTARMAWAVRTSQHEDIRLEQPTPETMNPTGPTSL